MCHGRPSRSCRDRRVTYSPAAIRSAHPGRRLRLGKLRWPWSASTLYFTPTTWPQGLRLSYMIACMRLPVILFPSTYCCSALPYFLFPLALLPSHPPMLPSGHSHWRGGRSPSPMGQVRGAVWIKNPFLEKNPRGKRLQEGKTILQRVI